MAVFTFFPYFELAIPFFICYNDILKKWKKVYDNS